MKVIEVPDALAFLEFFESEAIESLPDEGYFCYESVSNDGIGLRFSYSIAQASVQVQLFVRENCIAVISEECCNRICVENDKRGESLACSFDLGGARSKVNIFLRPEIKINWYTLEE